MTRWLVLVGLCLSTVTYADEPIDPSRQPSEKVTKALDAGLRKVDGTSFEITRTAARTVLTDESSLRGARMVPAMKNGKLEGVKIYAIYPNTVYARIGLTNGDTIHAVNGLPLNTTEDMTAALAKLRTSLVDLKTPLAQIAINIMRRGQAVTLTYKIK